MTEPQRTGRSIGFLSSAIAVLWCVGPLVVLAYTLMHKEIVSNFGVQLGAVTVATINTVDWLLGNYPTAGAMPVPGIVFVAPVWLGVAVVAVVLVSRPGTRKAGELALLAMVVLLATALVLIVITMQSDLRAISSALSA